MRVLFALLIFIYPAAVVAQSLDPPRPLAPPPAVEDPILSKYLYEQYEELERLRHQLADTERRLELVEKTLADEMQKEMDRLTIGPHRPRP